MQDYGEYSDSTDPSEIELYYSPTLIREEEAEQKRLEEARRLRLKRETSLSKEEIIRLIEQIRTDYKSSFVKANQNQGLSIQKLA